MKKTEKFGCCSSPSFSRSSKTGIITCLWSFWSRWSSYLPFHFFSTKLMNFLMLVNWLILTICSRGLVLSHELLSFSRWFHVMDVSAFNVYSSVPVLCVRTGAVQCVSAVRYIQRAVLSWMAGKFSFVYTSKGFIIVMSLASLST